MRAFIPLPVLFLAMVGICRAEPAGANRSLQAFRPFLQPSDGTVPEELDRAMLINERLYRMEFDRLRAWLDRMDESRDIEMEWRIDPRQPLQFRIDPPQRTAPGGGGRLRVR